jgi:hypothetical protein
MARFGKLLQLTVLILICGTAWANSISITVGNPDFATPAVACGSGYAYQQSGGCGASDYPQQDFNGTPGFDWTFGAGGNGLTGSGTAFNPPGFDSLGFSQAAFLQGDAASVSQLLTGPAGIWTVSFYLGSRYGNGCCDGNQTVEVLLNGQNVGTYSLLNFTPFTLETTLPLALGAGSYMLEFEGTAAGDHTAFVSGVTASDQVPEPVSFGLLGAGLIGLGLLRPSRRRAA